MVAAPKNGPVADFEERLQRVILEDKHVLADLGAVFGPDPVGRLRADIAQKRISFGAGRGHEFGPYGVHLAVADCDEHVDLAWCKNLLDGLKGDEGTVAEHGTGLDLTCGSESNDLVVTVVRQIELDDLFGARYLCGKLSFSQKTLGVWGAICAALSSGLGSAW